MLTPARISLAIVVLGGCWLFAGSWSLGGQEPPVLLNLSSFQEFTFKQWGYTDSLVRARITRAGESEYHLEARVVEASGEVKEFPPRPLTAGEAAAVRDVFTTVRLSHDLPGGCALAGLPCCLGGFAWVTESGDLLGATDDMCSPPSVDGQTARATVELLARLSRASGDCNMNGVLDALDLERGAADQDGDGLLDTCEDFLRGDSNGDGALDVSDPVNTLQWLFLAEGEIACGDSADANDDGGLDISDAAYTLAALFLGAGPLPASCGIDPTEDDLQCGRPGRCP